ncbi:hypothetical protein GGF31_004427 [Allomyces arbusculus]|nr:hypothetical protein GGF31_004427 [Allomyces arbusculus]
MILHPPPSADRAPTALHEDSLSFHDASRSMAARAPGQVDWSSRGMTATLTHEQLVGTIVWNVLDLFFLALFLYLAYVRKVEFLERRYPLLVAVQAVANCLWANAFLQSPSAIKWLPQGPDGPLGGSVPRFFLATATCPLWFASCTMRAFSVIADHFANMQMLHDTSKCCAIWTDHLTPTERRFLTALDWLFGTRPHAHTTVSATSTDSDSIWTVSATTVSPSVALLTDGGGGAPMRAPSASALAMRRITTRAQLKALFGATAFGLLVLIPAGMAASHCFTDPAAVPTALPYPDCLSNPLYSAKKYLPLVAVLLTFIAVLPLLFVLMRGIRDTHYLRLEIMSQFVVLDLLVVGYLLMSTVFTKSAPPIIAESALVLFSLIEAMIHALVIPTVYCLWKGWTETRQCPRLAVGKSSLTTVNLELSPESLKYILQLFATYVAADAPRELNLSSRSRELVAAEAKAGTLRVASFASVKDEVFQAMYTNSLPRFLAELAEGAAGRRPAIYVWKEW